MNHTRFPKEDHLPYWASRDNEDTKGDRAQVTGNILDKMNELSTLRVRHKEL